MRAEDCNKDAGEYRVGLGGRGAGTDGKYKETLCYSCARTFGTVPEEVVEEVEDSKNQPGEM